MPQASRGHPSACHHPASALGSRSPFLASPTRPAARPVRRQLCRAHRRPAPPHPASSPRVAARARWTRRRIAARSPTVPLGAGWGWAISVPMGIPAVDCGASCIAQAAVAISKRPMARRCMGSVAAHQQEGPGPQTPPHEAQILGQSGPCQAHILGQAAHFLGQQPTNSSSNSHAWPTVCAQRQAGSQQLPAQFLRPAGCQPPLQEGADFRWADIEPLGDHLQTRAMTREGRFQAVDVLGSYLCNHLGRHRLLPDLVGLCR